MKGWETRRADVLEVKYEGHSLVVELEAEGGNVIVGI